MTIGQFETSILFLIFNRPDTTQLVFNEIKKIKPKKLFIAADGPRGNKDGEKEKCEKTKDLVINNIDWDCEVKTLFREKNLGCKIAVSGAITWFFENVEEGIILEDDCLPDKSFFPYCSELLEKYRFDTRIMHIGGTNFQDGIKRGDGSYYYSRYFHVWGWATWKRAWSLYDVNIKSFYSFRNNNLIKNLFDNLNIRNFVLNNFNRVYEGEVDTWDYQWVYTILSNNGLSVIPNINLISNIGYGEDATHTKNINDKSANRKKYNIENIIHPTFIIPDLTADDYTYEFHCGLKLTGEDKKKKNLLIKIIHKLKKIISKIL